MNMDTPETLAWHKSACNLCYINCGVELAVAGQGDQARIVKVRGDRDNPRSAGYLCNKAQSIPSYVHHRDRLTTPLRRRADGGFDAIDWDTAIAEIAATLSAGGLDAQKIFELSQDPQVKDMLLKNTQSAHDRGAFGSPSFLVGDQLWFGKDRLRDVEEEIVRVASA